MHVQIYKIHVENYLIEYILLLFTTTSNCTYPRKIREALSVLDVKCLLLSSKCYFYFLFFIISVKFSFPFDETNDEYIKFKDLQK